MCNIVVGSVLTAVGAVLVVVSSIVGYGVVPDIVHRMIVDEVVLYNNSEQMERFEQVPFPLSFKVFFFNIENPTEVLEGGIPIVDERGPYVYKLNNSRLIDGMEEDLIMYRRLESFEFDADASHPLTEDDMVTVTNVAYHGILQSAEAIFPSLMFAINTAMPSIFGANNSPIMTVRVRDLLLDGVRICENPGIIGSVACSQVKSIGASVQNLEELPDGTLQFTLLGYKQDKPSKDYVVYRGLTDHYDLGRIVTYNGSSKFPNWNDDVSENGETTTSTCNTVRGTDSGIYHPFIDRDENIYAINTDICRSVQIRYQYDTEYEGIPTTYFSANEWLFDNNEGCYCVNATKGLTGEDGCLLTGAMELFTCVGAFLVLSYPHFLYADFAYRNGIIGMNPVEKDHRIFLEIEPNTGTVVRGYKRAQFNIFMRPVSSIPATQSLRTTLMPIFWIEEGMQLPEEYVNMLKNRLLAPLNLVEIMIPVLVALSALVTVIGIIIIVKVKCSKN